MMYVMNSFLRKAFLTLICISANAAWISSVCAETVFQKHFQAAEKLYKQGEFLKALKECNLAIAEEPNNWEGYYKRAKCYSETDSPADGMADFKKALSLNPKAPEIWISRALAFKRLKEYKNSQQDLAKAIQLDPTNSKGVHKMLLLCELMNDNKRGIVYATGALRHKVDVLDNTLRRGYFYAGIGDRKNMQADFESAISIVEKQSKPEKTAQVLNEQGKAFIKLGDADSALKSFESALKLDPGQTTYMCNIGGALLKKNENQKALEILTEGCKKRTDSASMHNNRGIALERLGKHAEAKNEYTLAIKHDERSNYFSNHARASLKLGETAEAMDDLVAIKTRSVKGPEAVDVRSSALQQFDSMIKLNPSDPTNYYNRGVINLCERKHKEACADFTKFLNMQNGQGESAVYGSILLYITLKNLHQARQADSILEGANSLTGSPWTKQLLSLFTEKSSLEDFMDSHQSRQRELAVHCFLGLKYLAEGKNALVTQRLKWVREHGNSNQDEYMLALSGLGKIAGNTSSSAVPIKAKDTLIVAQEPEISFK